MEPIETTAEAATLEAARSAQRLQAMAALHRALHPQADSHHTLREWAPGAGTFCYQTHIAVSNQPPERLPWLAEVFYNAATLKHQPWYPQFQGGRAQACELARDTGIVAHQLAWGRFDLGLGQPRYYRQLVSLARPDAHTAVIVARSVAEGPSLPEAARLAYTQMPNGEVLHWENDRLHWHHICCTPGAGLLPVLPDRWLINVLRRLGLDAAERNTYRGEALQLRDWLQAANPQQALAFTAADDSG